MRVYAIGLSGYAAIKVLVPCFYALDRPRTPLMVSLLGIGINLAMNLMLVKVFHMGHVGLAATTGCLALINFIQLAVYLRRDVAYGHAREWLTYAGAIVLATAACGAAAWGTITWLGGYGTGFLWRLFSLGAAIGAGGAAYVVVTFLLRINETTQTVMMLKRLAAGRPPAAG